MDPISQLTALMDLAENLGVEIRRAPGGGDGDHPGGALVRLRGKDIVFLNGDAAVVEQIEVLAAALAQKPEVQQMFLPPQLRQILDSAGRGSS